MSRPDRIDTDAPFDASIRTIDLRIAVGRHYNLGFEERVASANSNSLAAIYFTRRQLDVIGRDLGIDVDELNKPELQDAIRTAVGCDPRSPEGLDWIELKSLVLEAGVESTPIAETRYTAEENGLEQAWHGDVWLNPPFGDAPSTGPSKRETWLTKARNEARRADVRTVTCLLPVDTSTKWFHRHVVEAPVLCLMGPGRLEFEGEKPEDTGNTSFATCIAVYGDPPKDLVTALEEFGAVFRGREYHRSTVQRTLVSATDGGNARPQDTDCCRGEGDR